METTNVESGDLNYDSYADEKYDKDIIGVIPHYHELHSKIAEFVTKNFSPNQTYSILDLGAGTGNTSRLLKDLLPQAKFDVVDFSKSMLDGARKKLGDSDVKYILADYAETNFDENKYDLIISVIGLHHQNTAGKKKVLEKIYQSLKPGGWFILGDLVTHKDENIAALNQAKHFHHLVENTSDDITLTEWSYHHLYLNDLAPKEELIKWIDDLGFETKTLLQKINTLLLVAQKPITTKDNSSELFPDEVQNYQVQTNKLGKTRYVNFDNAATTPPLQVVQEKIQNFMSHYGSVHRGAGQKSQVSTDQYEKSREVIKNFVHAPMNSYVLFSNNTTGGMNMLAHFFSFLPGKIAVSSIEHSSSWLPWIKSEGIRHLDKQRHSDNEKTLGEEIQNTGKKFVLTYDVNNDLEFDIRDIEKILSDNKIKALVVTASSNVTGYCPDLKTIGQLCKKYNTYFIVDACQYIQHKKIDMTDLKIDFLIASGHKFYAPYGSGFIIGPKHFFDQFLPYQIGGGNIDYIDEDGKFYWQKNNLTHDPGTPNAAGAIAMTVALQKLSEIGLENIHRHEYRIAKKIYDYLKSNKKITVHTKENHLNSIITFNIKGLTPEKTAQMLNDDYGIGVRSGNFCVYNVIRKLTDNNEGVVRVSVGLCNDMEDAKRLIWAVEEMTKINLPLDNGQT